MATIDAYLNESKRRDKLYIMAEILEIAEEGSLKTRIMYRANLSFTQLKKYLKTMSEMGLLEKTKVGENDGYKATERGIELLERYRGIKPLLSKPKNENTHGSVDRIKIKGPKLL